MAAIAYIINDVKTGKTYQKKLEDNLFQGKKIGENIQGGVLGLNGYELEITGGSDNAGVPLLGHIDGMGRKKVLLSRGVAAKKKITRKGMMIRKTVMGNMVSSHIAQVNLKVVKYGTKPLSDLVGGKKEEKKEDVKEEKTQQKKDVVEEKKEEKKE